MWMMNSLIQSIVTFLFPVQCFICKKNRDVLCRDCLRSILPPLDTPHHFIFSRYSYKDTRIKRVVHAIKFFHRKDLLTPISQELVTLLPEKRDDWVLVPIPMPSLRRMLRGYNQSELLAAKLGTISGMPIDTSLLKRKSSPSRQVRAHNKKERLRNQKNTFRSIKNVVGLNIILIDDVTTTGSTLFEARKILLSGGARSVIAITIAH